MLLLVQVGVLVPFLLVERVVHALSYLLAHFLIGTKSSARTLSAMNVLSALSLGTYNLVSAVTNFAVGVGVALLSNVVLLVAISIVLAFCTLLFELTPQLLGEWTRLYNAGIGSSVRAVVLIPVQFADMFFTALLPLYNAVTWILVRLIFSVGWPAITEFASDFAKVLTAFADLVVDSTVSASFYLGTVGPCLDSFPNITNTSQFNVSTRCFEPGLRTIDLVTPMKNVRILMAWGVVFAKRNCVPLSAMLDILTFPFMDINLAKAVHLIVNSFQYLLVQLPIITEERCLYSKRVPLDDGGLYDTVMCIPDFEPFADFLAGGLRHLGYMIDNWIAIIYVISQEYVGLGSPSCSPLPLADISYQPITSALFGQNQTKVVGLTSGLYAVTDGWATQYVSYYREYEVTTQLNAWPFPINVSLGVAAVSYNGAETRDSDGSSKTSMLGCRCRDVELEDPSLSETGTEMQIDCAISPKDPESQELLLNGTDYYVPVRFALPSTARYMQCKSTRISVQSVRWPIDRTSTPGEFVDRRDPILDYVQGDPTDSSTVIDAAIWVVPMCRATSEVDAVCLEAFTEAACYPFCMAARVRDSVNSELTLFDSDDWNQHVQLSKRDCQISELDATTVELEYSQRGLTDATYANSYQVENDYLQGVVFGQTYDRPGSFAGSCKYNEQVVSRLQRNGTAFVEPYESIRIPDQPFMFAGDVVLYSEQVNSQYFIRADRIFGDENSFFSLVTVNARIPSSRPCETPSNCDNIYYPERVNIPYGRQTLSHLTYPSASSKWSVFFAVNPYVDVFSSYFELCRNPANSGKLQFVPQSSYSAIRVWKVDPFADYGTRSNTVTSQPVGSSVEIPGAFPGSMLYEECGNPFNMAITSMEYLNEDNIAMTVLRAPPRSIDPWTQQPVAFLEDISYNVWFLNPKTMQVQEGETFVNEEEAQVISVQGRLCPSQRRLPEFGSLLMEAAVSALYFGYMPVNFLVNLPAFSNPKIFSQVEKCAPVTRGHSLLKTCGRNIVSLDKSYEALKRANGHFWRSLSILGTQLQDKETGPQVQTFLNGAQVVGEATRFPVIDSRMQMVYSAIGDIGNMRISNLKGTFLSLSSWARSGMTFSVSIVSIGKFSFDFIVELVFRVIFRAAQGRNVNSLLWETAYDMKGKADEYIFKPQLRACTGASLMFGYSNPFAQFIRTSCASSVHLQRGMFDATTVFYVDYPILSCLCAASHNHDFHNYAVNVCYKDAPTHFKPVILSMIQESVSRGLPADSCKQMASFAVDRLEGSMDSFFHNSFQNAESMGNLIDYLIKALDEDAGNCDNILVNPNVLSIIPQPVDYFRTCGDTSTCRLKCLTEIEAFEASRSNDISTSSDVEFSQTVESRFFQQTENDASSMQMPLNVLSLIELTSCEYTCGHGANTTIVADKCFEILGIDDFERMMGITYCVPSDPRLGIRQAHNYTLQGSQSWSAAVQKAFILGTFTIADSVNLALVRTFSEIAIYNTLGSKLLLKKVIQPSVAKFEQYDMVEIIDVVVFPFTQYARVAIDGRVMKEDSAGDRIVEDLRLCYFVSFNSLSSYTEEPCEATVFDIMRDYYPVCLGSICRELLLVPLKDKLSIGKCNFDPVTASFVPGSCIYAPYQRSIATSLGVNTIYNGFGISSDMISVPRQQRIAQNSLSFVSPYEVLMTNHPDVPVAWLQEIRLDFGDGGVTIANSMNIDLEVLITQSCNLMQCGGCSLSTQRLCYAAQQCALARCVGAMVNLDRPLCALGGMAKNNYEYQVTILQNFWITGIGLLRFITDLSTGNLDNGVDLEFIIQVFDNLMCEVKDGITQMVALVVSVLKYGVNKIEDALQPEAALGAGKLGVNNYAVSGMAMQALAQLGTNILLFPLYGGGAAFKMAKGGLKSFAAKFKQGAKTTGQTPKQIMNTVRNPKKLAGDFVVSIKSKAEQLKENARSLAKTAGNTQGIKAKIESTKEKLSAQYKVMKEKAQASLESTGVSGLGGLKQKAKADSLKKELELYESQFKRTYGGNLREKAEDTSFFAIISQVFEEDVENLGNPQSSSSVESIIAGLLIDIGEMYAMMQIDLITESMIAMLTYAEGVVLGVMDFMQTLDQKHCKLPDLTMAEVPKCSCGDIPIRINVERRVEGLAEHAFWCTGTLQLTNEFGEPFLMFNPYTFTELEASWNRLDAYLGCIAQGDSACEQFVPVFEAFVIQEVSPLAVFVRCRSNYVNKQWDLGAAALFADVLHPHLEVHQDLINERISGVEFNAAIATCMSNAIAEGYSNDRCMQDFLQLSDIKKDDYFSYEKVDESQIAAFPSHLIDGCEVFTGPAQLASPVSDEFKLCLDHSQSDLPGNCKLQPFVWSGRSSNMVPVAVSHTVLNHTDENKLAIAQAEHMRIREYVVGELLRINSSWTGDALDIDIFTYEGDAIHQTFDCMILGPYAKADLWPSGSLRRLPVPQYYRDEEAGFTRNFELPCTEEALGNDTESPYTCGSGVRRAMIKHFVRDGDFFTGDGNKNQAVINAVRAQIAELINVWSNPQLYHCTCADLTHSMDCCIQGNTTSFLSLPLANTDFTDVEPTKLVEGLIDSIIQFTTQDILTKTDTLLRYNTESYTWGDSDKVTARDLGQFHTADAVLRYDETEVESPLDVSIWSLCTGLLGQVYFSVPMRENSNGTWTLKSILDSTVFDPMKDTATGSYLNAIERAISQWTEEAYFHSPFYWHYQMQYVPSDSNICEKQQGATKLDGGLDIQDTTVASTNMWDLITRTSRSAFFHLHHFNQSLIGSVRDECFCGWRQDASCYIPSPVCVAQDWSLIDATINDICQNHQGRYTTDTETVIRVLSANWVDSWNCKHMIPGSLWGLIDDEEAWMRGEDKKYYVNLQDILTKGKSGVRAGNLLELKQNWFRQVSPGHRIDPLVHPTENITVAQRTCASDLDSLLDSHEYLDRWHNEFFPAAQGLNEPPSVHYCMRFAIEYSKALFMRMVNGSNPLNLENQETITSSWREKCKTHLDMIGFCELRGAFEHVPSTAGTDAEHCPFDLSLDTGTSYVTTGCIVFADGDFYNPCDCYDCSSGSASVTIAALKNLCSPTLDIRTMVDIQTHPPSMYWALDWQQTLLSQTQELKHEHTVTEIQAAEFSADIPKTFNGAAFLDNFVLDSAGFKTIGNANTDWRKDEGWASSTTRFCDLLSDWWPEDWVHPVGYHPSIPCASAHVSYRSFDAVWATEAASGEFDVVRFVYGKDYLRNRSLDENYFGSSSHCRAANYGLEMRRINTMELCTRQIEDPHIDPTVPINPYSSVEQQVWEETEYCSGFTDEGVWDPYGGTDYYNPESIGLVTSWFQESGLNWPEDTVHIPWIYGKEEIETELDAGGDGLGQGCVLSNLFTCAEDADCTNEALSSIGTDNYLSCYQGVCVQKKQPSDTSVTFDCVNHEQCEEPLMCSGEGRCVQPFFEFQNNYSSRVEFGLYAEYCASGQHEFDTMGISPWQTVPTFMQDSGFCGYRRWFEYRDMLERAGCDEQQQYCTVGPQSFIYHTDIGVPATQGNLFADNYMKVQPNICDRDYQYINGFKSCVPQDPVTFGQDGQQKTSQYHKDFSTFKGRPGNWTLDIPVNPYFRNEEAGFLLESLRFDSDQSSENMVLKPCADIRQCYVQDFSVNGKIVEQRLRVNSVTWDGSSGVALTPYLMQEQFKCGPFGMGIKDQNVQNNDGVVSCIVDPSVNAFFVVLCKDPVLRAQIVADCPVKSGFNLDQTCTLLNEPYTPENSNAYSREDIFVLLQDLYRAFENDFQTFEQYLDRMQCAETLYTAIRNSPYLQTPKYTLNRGTEEDPFFTQEAPVNLYYPLEFSLTEFPFLWWVRCYLLSGITIRTSGVTECPAWSDVGPSGINPDLQELDLKRFLQRAAGGYDKDYVEEASRRGVTSRFNAISNIELISNAVFRDLAASVPTEMNCQTRKSWVDEWLDEEEYKTLVDLVSIKGQIQILPQYTIDTDGITCTGEDTLVETTEACVRADSPVTVANDQVGGITSILRDFFSENWGQFTPEVQTNLQEGGDFLRRIDPIEESLSFENSQLAVYEYSFLRLSALDKIRSYVESTYFVQEFCNPVYWTGVDWSDLDHGGEFCLNPVDTSESLNLIDTSVPPYISISRLALSSDPSADYLGDTQQYSRLAISRDTVMIDICSLGNTKDQYGSACNLQEQGLPEQCEDLWASVYSQTCTGSEFSSEVQSYNKGDMCWRTDSTCFGDSVNEFDRIRGLYVPPGLSVRTYGTDTEAAIETNSVINGHIPEDAFCAGTGLGSNFGSIQTREEWETKCTSIPENSGNKLAVVKWYLQGLRDKWTRQLATLVLKDASEKYDFLEAKIDFSEDSSFLERFRDTFTQADSAFNLASFFGVEKPDYDEEKAKETVFQMYMEIGSRILTTAEEHGSEAAMYVLFTSLKWNYLPVLDGLCGTSDFTDFLETFECFYEDFFPDYEHEMNTDAQQACNFCTGDHIYLRQVMKCVDGGTLHDVSNVNGQTYKKWLFGTEDDKPRFRGGRDLNAVVNFVPNRLSQPLLSQTEHITGLRITKLSSYTCDVSECDSQGLGALQIRRGYYQCLPCLKAVNTYCNGRFDCRFSRPTFTDSQLDFDQSARFQNYGSLFTASEFLNYVGEVFISQIKRLLGGSDQYKLLMRTDYRFLTTNFDMPVFSLLDAETYEQGLGTDQNGESNPRSCANAESTTLVDYQVCRLNEQGRQDFDFMQQHMDSRYKFNHRPTAEPSETLQFATSKQQMLRESLPVWFENVRNYPDVFVDYVLNITHHCSESSIYDSVCRVKANNEIVPFLPWTGGDFFVDENPVSACDTETETDGLRYIDVRCNLELTELCPSQTQGPYYENMYSSCLGRNGELLNKRVTVFGSPADLCSHKPRTQTQCSHPQGMLGGYNGVPVESVYERQTLANKGTTSGLFDDNTRNRFLASESLSDNYYGILKQLSTEIGGHHIRIQLHTDGVLRVKSVILKDTGTPEQLIATVATDDWLRFIGIDMDAELAKVTGRYKTETTSNPDWSCPFRKVHFHSGVSNPRFGPLVPDPRRTERFYPTLARKGVHPTQKVRDDHEHSLRYRTSNGFCFCDDPADCTIPKSVQSDQCSLFQTVRSTFDQSWRTSKLVSAATCHDQIDWPYVGGTLRDGNNFTRSSLNPRCNFLDRLDPFQYRYRTRSLQDANSGQSQRQSNVQSDGQCHTGRSAEIPTSFHATYSRCKRVHKNSTTLVLACNDDDNGPGEFVELPIDKSKTPAWMLQHMWDRRQGCDQCSATPTFHTSDGTEIPAETSFGIPFRMSPSRFVAQDLRNKYCTDPNNCDTAKHFNSQKWTPDLFMQTLFTQVTTLMQDSALDANADQITSFDSLVRQSKDYNQDAELWTVPWVFCNQTEEFGLICEGAINKTTWLNPKTRGPACKSALQQSGKTNLAEGVKICSLDYHMDQLCTLLAKARLEVADANCFFTDTCTKSQFIYHPSTYSTVDRQFVGSIVEDFYQDIQSSACPDRDDLTQQLREQNENLARSCASYHLQSFRTLLVTLKGITRVLAKIWTNFFMMSLHFLRLLDQSLTATGIQDVLASVWEYLGRLLAEALVLVQQLMNLIFELLWDSPLGKAIRLVITAMCHFVQWLYHNAWCKLLVEGLFKGLLYSVADIVNSISLGTAGDSIKTWVDERVAEAGCGENRVDFNCTWPWEEPLGTGGALPVATRCWSTYVSSLGDESSLSCTAADTCKVANFLDSSVADIDSLVVCDACPDPPATDFSRYACNPVTKFCQCSVQELTSTACTSHQDCSLNPASTCQFTDTDYETSFGNTPCAQCINEPMCIQSSGSDSGFCSCMLRPQPLEQCSSTEVGDRVSPDPLGLCAITMGSITALTNTRADYSVVYERTAAAPCYAVDLGQTYCYNVLRQGVNIPLTVSLQTLQLRRRLLEESDRGTFERNQMIYTLDWNTAPDSVCFEVVEAYKANTTLGVLDKRQLQSCLKWRALGLRFKTKYNLSAVSDSFLLSTQDFALHTARYDAMSQVLGNLDLFSDIAMHSEYVLPIRALYRMAIRLVTSSIEEYITLHPNITAELQDYKHMLATLRGDLLKASEESNNRLNISLNVFMETSSPFTTLRIETHSGNLQKNDRRLLTWRDDFNAIDEFSLTALNNGGYPTNLNTEVADEFVKGPGQWPPKYTYWEDTTQQCPARGAFYELSTYAFGKAVDRYRNQGPAQAIPARVIQKGWPNITKKHNESEHKFGSSEDGPEDLSWIIGQSLLKVLEKLGLNKAFFLDWFDSFPETLQELTVCDFDSVMFCTRYRRSLTVSIFVVGLFYFLLGLLADNLKLKYAKTFLVFTFPFMLLYYSLGYSPSCFPTIPSCFITETLETIDFFFPAAIRWPDALQIYPGCIDGTVTRPPSISPSKPCLVSCFQEPFRYRKAEDVFSWWFCDFDRALCTDLADWLDAKKLWGTSALRSSLRDKIYVLVNSATDVHNAERICAGLTSWFLILWILILFVLIAVSALSLVIPIVILQGSINLGLMALQMTHTQ